MAEGAKDNIRRQTDELHDLHQSISKAWDTGLNNEEAARALDELVCRYEDVLIVLSGDDEKASVDVQKAVKQVAVRAMDVWDRLAQSKKDEAWKAIDRRDIPADLTSAVRIVWDGDNKLKQAVAVSGDIQSLSLYEEAVDIYQKACQEIRLIEQGIRGLQKTERFQIRLNIGQIIVAVISMFIGVVGTAFVLLYQK